jgi:tetratricopeptide (TPR) repeat protein
MVQRLGERLASIWDRLIYPVEWAAACLWDKSLHLSDRLESADSLFHSLGVLLRGLRTLANLVARFLCPAPVRRLLANSGLWLTYVGMRALEGVVRVASWLNLDLFVIGMVWHTRLVWRPILALAGFAFAWGSTRTLRRLLCAAPATILLLPCLVVANRALHPDPAALISTYRTALAEATHVGDQRAIELYERKLAHLGANTHWQQFLRAVALAESSQTDDAFQTMQKLAPERHLGYPPAHLWIVQQARAGALDLTESQRAELIDNHLAQLERLEFTDDRVLLLKGFWQLEREEYTSAAATFRPLIDREKVAAYRVLRIDFYEGRTEMLPRDAMAVLSHITELQRAGLPLATDDYAHWALAVETQRDAVTLEHVLLEWNDRHPDDRAARESLRLFLQKRVEELLESGTANPASIAGLISRAERLGVDQRWLEARIGRLYELRDHAVVATPLPERVIEHLLADSEASLAVLMAIGNCAANSHEWPRAHDCFLRATRANPQSAAAWNNLAWVLAQQGAFDEAFGTVTRALAIAPLEAEFRETRGQICLKMGRFEQAIADLEYARQRLSPSPALENALGVAYAARGTQSSPEESHGGN